MKEECDICIVLEDPKARHAAFEEIARLNGDIKRLRAERDDLIEVAGANAGEVLRLRAELARHRADAIGTALANSYGAELSAMRPVVEAALAWAVPEDVYLAMSDEESGALSRALEAAVAAYREAAAGDPSHDGRCDLCGASITLESCKGVGRGVYACAECHRLLTTPTLTLEQARTLLEWCFTASAKYGNLPKEVAPAYAALRRIAEGT